MSTIIDDLKYLILIQTFCVVTLNDYRVSDTIIHVKQISLLKYFETIVSYILFNHKSSYPLYLKYYTIFNLYISEEKFNA